MKIDSTEVITDTALGFFVRIAYSPSTLFDLSMFISNLY